MRVDPAAVAPAVLRDICSPDHNPPENPQCPGASQTVLAIHFEYERKPSVSHLGVKSGVIVMRKLVGVAAILFVSLFLLMFAVYSARGLFAPELMSARFFGLPTVDADGALYYRVYLSRNLAIVVAGFVFLLRRQWQPLAVLTTAAMALPVFDATVLYNVLGGQPGSRYTLQRSRSLALPRYSCGSMSATPAADASWSSTRKAHCFW